METNDPQRQIAVFTGLVIGIAVIAWALFRPGQEGSSSEIDPIPKAAKTKPERSVSFREQLRSAKRAPDLLVERLDEVLARKLLKDAEFRRIYRSNFSRFSPEVLAKLTVHEAAFHGGGVVQMYVAESGDLRFVLAYLHALGEDTDAKRMLLQHLGSDSVLLAPDRISAFLEQLPDMSDGEWRAMGYGLRSRVRTHTKDPDAKIESLNKYLGTVKHPEVLRRLAMAAVDVMETDEAIEWLKAGDPEIMGSGDVTLMRSLKTDELGKGFDMINFFLGDGQLERAQKAIEGFLPGYASRQPHDALAWVDSMDDTVRTHQMMATAFRALYNSDSAGATALLESIEDPEIRRLYESQVDGAERLKELKANRDRDKARSARR